MGHPEDRGNTIPIQSLFLVSIFGATHSSRHWLSLGFFAERHLLQAVSLFLLVQPEKVIEFNFFFQLVVCLNIFSIDEIFDLKSQLKEW